MLWDSLQKYAGETFNSIKDAAMEKIPSIKDSVVFHISLGYNIVNHDRENQPWWDRVTDNIVLGALPFHDRNHQQKLIEKENIRGSSDYVPGF